MQKEKDLSYQLSLLEITRKNILDATAPYSVDQLNKIPTGFANNLIWQLGHVLVTQQLLQYSLSGIEPKIRKELIPKYRKGTHPEENVAEEEVRYIREMLVETTALFRQDLKEGIFKKYSTYTTSYNVTLTSIEEAIAFNNLHEALHYGYMLSIRKFL
ncbi:MAG: hypothetical protein DHS20C18_36660 [Saprospiraceae bacterium]|nr:MAG: hypothetical protein DHS20C18_36660 [Saprospiraceae bacterium]